MKSFLRNELKKVRQSLCQRRKKEAAIAALKAFSTLEGNILSFASFGEEIDLWKLNHHFAREKRLYLPRIETNHIRPYFVEDPTNQLVLSTWGILEPSPEICLAIDSKHLDVILVPGLAFDLEKHRIGYGRGYYDRLLAQLTDAKIIGVGFREQLLDHPIPTEKTDQLLDELALF